jgi:hypothetical protein
MGDEEGGVESCGRARERRGAARARVLVVVVVVVVAFAPSNGDFWIGPLSSPQVDHSPQL